MYTCINDQSSYLTTDLYKYTTRPQYPPPLCVDAMTDNLTVNMTDTSLTSGIVEEAWRIRIRAVHNMNIIKLQLCKSLQLGHSSSYKLTSGCV